MTDINRAAAEDMLLLARSRKTIDHDSAVLTGRYAILGDSFGVTEWVEVETYDAPSGADPAVSGYCWICMRDGSVVGSLADYLYDPSPAAVYRGGPQ